MKVMKKIMAVLGILFCMAFLPACGREDQNSTAVGGKAEPETVEKTAEKAMGETVTEQTETVKKPLVVYFSQSGNTEQIAYDIQELTGADLFRITTVEGYLDDLDELYDRGQAELDANARPELAETVTNIEEYDTVFLGYPIWGGTCPMAVFSFLEQHDFTGKTVIPFCTHGGSGFSGSISDIEEILPETVPLLEGFSVYGTEAKEAYQDVENWLKEINYK